MKKTKTFTHPNNLKPANDATVVKKPTPANRSLNAPARVKPTNYGTSKY
jgi:hypothetical protein